MNDSLSSGSSLIGRESPPTAGELNLQVLADWAGRVLRWTARGIVLLMLIVGVYYAFDVFFQVGALLRDPAAAEASVLAVSGLIEGEKLRFDHFGEVIEVGRLVAVLVLGLGYVLLASIPLWIIGTAARVLQALGNHHPTSAQKTADST